MTRVLLVLLLSGAAIAQSADPALDPASDPALDPAIEAPAASASSDGDRPLEPRTVEALTEAPVAEIRPSQGGLAAPALVVDDPAADAEQLVDRLHEALRNGDRQALLATLSADVMIAAGGRVDRSRDEYAHRHLADDISDFSFQRRDLLRRELRHVGDLIWIVNEWRTLRVLAGIDVRYDEAETLIVRRDAEGWRIIHRHVSARPELAAP